MGSALRARSLCYDFFDLQEKDKVAVVTGGAGSIGSALVQAFLQEGAKVVVCDVALEKNIFRDREFVDRNNNNLALLAGW